MNFVWCNVFFLVVKLTVADLCQFYLVLLQRFLNLFSIGLLFSYHFSQMSCDWFLYLGLDSGWHADFEHPGTSFTSQKCLDAEIPFRQTHRLSIVSFRHACFSHPKWLMLVYTYETSLLPVSLSYYSMGSHIYGVLEPYRVNLHRFVLLLRAVGWMYLPMFFTFNHLLALFHKVCPLQLISYAIFIDFYISLLLSLTSRDLFEMTENHVSTFP